MFYIHGVTGLFISWQLIIYGTSEQPINLHQQPRKPATTPTPSAAGEKHDQDASKEKNNKSEENESWLNKWNTNKNYPEVGFVVCCSLSASF